MFNVPGWMSGNANQEFNKTEGNQKTFISMPSLSGDAEDRFGNMYRGERQYVVNANTENPVLQNRMERSGRTVLECGGRRSRSYG